MDDALHVLAGYVVNLKVVIPMSKLFAVRRTAGRGGIKNIVGLGSTVQVGAPTQS